jgi:hypothetical protein
MNSNPNKYNLYDDNGDILSGKELHKLQRDMVHTMVNGKCHCANSDISVSGSTITIPEGLNVFIHNSDVLLFCRLGRQRNCLMLFIQNGSPYIFMEADRNVQSKIDVLKKIRKTKGMLHQVTSAIKKDKGDSIFLVEDDAVSDSDDKVSDSDDDDKAKDSENLYLKFYLGTYDISTFKNPQGDYRGKTPCRLADILAWKSDDEDEIMEKCHHYIQWVFPNLEPSNVHKIPPLSESEARLIRSDSTARANALKVYRWFLEFMGATMPDEKTGALYQGPNFSTQIKYFHGRDNHNFLRITRILKWLNLMGYAQYMKPLYIFCRCHFQDSNETAHNKWKHTFSLHSKSAFEEINVVDDVIKIDYDSESDKTRQYLLLMNQTFFPEKKMRNKKGNVDELFDIGIVGLVRGVQDNIANGKNKQAMKIIDRILRDYKKLTEEGQIKHQDTINQLLTQQLLLKESVQADQEQEKILIFKYRCEADVDIVRTLIKEGRLKEAHDLIKHTLNEWNKFKPDVQRPNKNIIEPLNILHQQVNDAFTLPGKTPPKAGIAAAEGGGGDMKKEKQAEVPVIPVGSFCWRTTTRDGKSIRTKVRVNRHMNDDPYGTYYECVELNTGNHIQMELANLKVINHTQFLAPLEELWVNQKFKPSPYLREKYNVQDSDEFNVDTLNPLISDSDVVIPETEKYSIENFWFQIKNDTAKQHGWVSGDILKRLSWIFCRMYRGVTKENTIEEMKTYIQDSKTRKYETFFIVDDDHYKQMMMSRQKPLTAKTNQKSLSVIDLSAFDNILVVMNTDLSTEGSHWVLGHIDTKRKTTGIYDSLSKDNTTQRNRLIQWRNEQFLRRMQGDQYLVNLEGERTDSERNRLRECATGIWNIKLYDVDKQDDGSSCGVYTAINMAYIMSSREADMFIDVNNGTLSLFRKWLCKILCEEDVGPVKEHEIIPDTPTEVKAYSRTPSR